MWLLNPDTTVEPTALEAMIDALHEWPSAGIVTSRMLGGDHRPGQVWYDGGRIDWTRAGAASIINNGRRFDEVAGDTRLRRTDYACGASMLIRREVLEEVGLLPEQYFLYFEDVDFSVRAERQGWDVILAPTSVVHHHQRSHALLPQPYYVYYYLRNRLAFGSSFTGLSVDDVLPFAKSWVDTWKEKIAQRAPSRVDPYLQLVELAIADARCGRSGRRDGVSQTHV